MPRDGTLLSPLFTCRAGSQLVSPGHPTHALCQRLCLSSAQGSQLLVWLFGGGWAVLSCFSEAPLWPCLVHEGGGCGSDWSSISSPCSPAAHRQGGISSWGTLLVLLTVAGCFPTPVLALLWWWVRGALVFRGRQFLMTTKPHQTPRSCSSTWFPLSWLSLIPPIGYV